MTEGGDDDAEPGSTVADGAEPGSTVEADDPDPTDGDREHLEEVPDGCGCVEVWEHLAERRENRE